MCVSDCVLTCLCTRVCVHVYLCAFVCVLVCVCVRAWEDVLHLPLLLVAVALLSPVLVSLCFSVSHTVMVSLLSLLSPSLLSLFSLSAHIWAAGLYLWFVFILFFSNQSLAYA